MNDFDTAFDSALEAHLQAWTVDPADRALCAHAFQAGWDARIGPEHVVVTRTWLAQLHASDPIAKLELRGIVKGK